MIRLLALAAAAVLALSPGVSTAQDSEPGLSSFTSDRELSAFLAKARVRPRPKVVSTMFAPPPPPPPPPAEPPAPSAGESITNTQEAGVDEGGLVKVRGDILVILRRGRLFTVSIAGGGLRPVDQIDAFAPGADPRGAWYDEMLVAGNRVVTIGYSYARGGTEVTRFRLDDAGKLTFEDAYQIKSADYYSSRNYASRLIGNDLILYSALPVAWTGDPLSAMPSMRRWAGQSGREGFRRIVGGRDVFIPAQMRRPNKIQIDTIHGVTRCNLLSEVIDCRATAVLGSYARVFYVSNSAVYLWVSNSWRDERLRKRQPSMVYRLPLDGRRPQAVAARGTPTDQFSFREDRQRDVLNVLVRSGGTGDSMWSADRANGSVALLTLPLARFGGGSDEVERSAYRDLPTVEGWNFNNRFVRDRVLYGSGRGWANGRQKLDGQLIVAPVAGGPSDRIPLAQPIDRIEVLGPDALVVGATDKDLIFSAIALPTSGPAAAVDSYVFPEASQGETRSHGFFFRPDPGGVDGLMGLPVAHPARPAYRQLFDSSAGMLFLRRKDRRLTPLGELEACTEGVVDDACQASCVDWYGNARPIFLRGRVFALLGYELVEGRVGEAGIGEIARVSFAPARKP